MLLNSQREDILVSSGTETYFKRSGKSQPANRKNLAIGESSPERPLWRTIHKFSPLPKTQARQKRQHLVRRGTALVDLGFPLLHLVLDPLLVQKVVGSAPWSRFRIPDIPVLCGPTRCRTVVTTDTPRFLWHHGGSKTRCGKGTERVVRVMTISTGTRGRRDSWHQNARVVNSRKMMRWQIDVWKKRSAIEKKHVALCVEVPSHGNLCDAGSRDSRKYLYNIVFGLEGKIQ